MLNEQVLNEQTSSSVGPSTRPHWVAKVLQIEWLGQTVASLCWIASVLTYGTTSAGDWLQLCAASAWLVANIAAATASEAD